jgi:hypothetical protein
MPLILKQCRPTVAAIGGEGHRTLLATFQQTSPSAMKLYQSIEESQNLSCLSLLHTHCLHRPHSFAASSLQLSITLHKSYFKRMGQISALLTCPFHLYYAFSMHIYTTKKKSSSSASISMYLFFQRKKHFLVQYGRIRLHPSNM